MRLIDADEMKKNLLMGIADEIGLYADLARQLLSAFADEQPTIDAVPVVRCKDCRYFHKTPRLIGEERDDGWCKWIAEKLVEQDHYCSWGIERNEDEVN